MPLADAFDQAAAGAARLADALRTITAAPIRIQVAAGAGSDRDEADAIKRGQRPEQVAALRKALGL
jgi:hypothetical protein